MSVDRPPIVSITLTTFNRARKFLPRAIESVLRQSFKHWELLVIDDASTDNTPEIVRSFGDDRIRYIRLEYNSGYQCIPRNTGIKASRGNLIAYLDDDDAYTPDHIGVLVDAFQRNRNIDVAYGNREYYDEQTGEGPFPGNGRPYDFYELFRSNFIGTPDMMHTREAIERVGGWDPLVRMAGDYDLVLRMAKQNCRFLFIPKVITICYSHSGSITTSRKLPAFRTVRTQRKTSVLREASGRIQFEVKKFFSSNERLRREFPLLGDSRALKVDGLNSQVIYESRFIHLGKRLFGLLKRIL